MINQTKTIAALYSDLCIRYRKLRIGKDAGAWVCTACQRTEKDHGYNDGRCTAYVTSASFRADETAQLKAVELAIALLDELKELPV